MKISIITPSYNSGDSIERAIKSVLHQDYIDYEHIIVDGASSDNTLEILKRYPHLKWLSEPDNGQVEAMNKGFSMSTGDIVAYLNADDYFHEGAFSAVIPHFRNGEDVVMGKVLVRTQRPDGVDEWVNDPKTDLNSMLHHWESDAFCVNPVGYFYRHFVQKEIPFNQQNDDKHDLAFLIEITLRYKIKKIDTILGVFNHFLTTKTAREQLIPSYWRNDNFSFIDRILKNMDDKYQKRFCLERERGYQLRRHWTIQDAFNRGLAKELIDEGEVFFLPEGENDTDIEKGSFVEFDRLATKRDWIIPVLTMKNVAGNAIYATLKALPQHVLPAEVYHLNQMNEKTILRNLPRSAHVSVGLSLNQLFNIHKNDLRWKFIVGMREPISYCLSCLFEIDRPELDMKAIADEIEKKIYPSISAWFGEQIKDALGIDIYDHEFDQNKGYSIIRMGNIEILLYRNENLREIFSQAIDDFLGIPDLQLLEKYITSNGILENAYKPEKWDIRFDKGFLERVYSSEPVTYFYSEEEISNFSDTWT